MQAQKVFGATLPEWKAPVRPGPAQIEGRYARLERLDPEAHAHALFAAYREDDSVWDYLPYGPFASEAGFIRWLGDMAASTDPLFYAIRDLDTGLIGGMQAFLRISPEVGSIELGHINMAARLQRRRAASEAMLLMIGWAFDAGYRRFEWKCDALNLPSRRAAERLGLSYEGVFRQATIYKGRNRDTAWFAAIDAEWPVLRAAYASWLEPRNFDADGGQILRLSDLTRPILAARDPARG
ncbi:MAG: GNAT family protein [Phaeovulum sp.]|uniref:GNAT family N-acetyltransferase n=1 Tax=Phaeovulum sp. TaxID=2934796 RepID=UPI002731BAD1|nr:GNAT family protein [Phaeovulum sp.]MDP2063341.1 GNAT family protein [Phaeovulum sp.]